MQASRGQDPPGISKSSTLDDSLKRNALVLGPSANSSRQIQFAANVRSGVDIAACLTVKTREPAWSPCGRSRSRRPLRPHLQRPKAHHDQASKIRRTLIHDSVQHKPDSCFRGSSSWQRARHALSPSVPKPDVQPWRTSSTPGPAGRQPSPRISAGSASVSASPNIRRIRRLPRNGGFPITTRSAAGQSGSWPSDRQHRIPALDRVQRLQNRVAILAEAADAASTGSRRSRPTPAPVRHA